MSLVSIAGIQVSRVGEAATLRRMSRWLEDAKPRRVATANLDFLRLAGRNADLRDALRTADHVCADGAPLVWLSRLLRRPIRERVTGADLAPELVRLAAEQGHSVFLLGGESGVAARAAERLSREQPALRVAGISDTRVDLNDEAACERIADEIRASGARLLLVALGCPKQDLFLRRYLDRTGCRIGIGVGATLDFLAGRVPRAPRWMQVSGLEWTYRLLQEPRRLFSRYLLDGLFLLRILPAALPRSRRFAYPSLVK